MTKWIFTLTLASVLSWTALTSGAVLLQQEAGVFAFEAEDYSSLTGSGWSVITTSGGTQTIPTGSNVVGDALYTHGGGSPSSFATYDLQFTSDGTYYVFTKYSMYDRSNSTPPPSYGNEDSFYLPRDLGIAAATGAGQDNDWYAQHLPSQGHLPAASETPNPNEGQYFYWDMGQFSGDSTAALTFTVTGASVENPLDVTFTIGNREGGVAIDRFVLSTTNYNASINGGNSATLDGIASVPEPSRSLFILLALVALALRRRR